MSNLFSPMEIDAIGEIMNISLGSSATAVSNLLDHRVDITTPRVSIVNAEDFSLGELDPAIGVEIKYVAGLTGSNIMLLKIHDVKVIVDILMGMETPEEEFELNELTLSAVCEVMNQMMGASSTALSDFLGRVVNISTPQTFDGSNVDDLRGQWLPVSQGPIVVVQFALSIEDSVQSEFINVMSVELAKEMISGFGLGDDEDSSAALETTAQPEGNRNLNQAQIEAMMAQQNAPAASGGGGMMSQEEIERMMSGMAAPTPTPTPAPSGGMMSQEEIERMMAGMAAPTPTPTPAASGGGGMMSQEEIERMMAGMSAPQAAPAQQQPAAQAPAGYPPFYGWPTGPDGKPMPYPPYYAWPSAPMAETRKPDQKVIQTTPVSMPRLQDGTELTEEQAHNLDLIMSVPLEIAVEIGRTRKKVQEIVSLSKGSLVVLDKLAGDQVDVYVNGKCIAQGDVVVIDDNFGIRITEILRRPGLEDLL
ncbi:MAG: flagellar motor switch protein FliN [Oscillospiraceae bacterium]|nr:flagellar motor switch protein FliN [Oscillospiraceae bacterium]